MAQPPNSRGGCIFLSSFSPSQTGSTSKISTGSRSASSPTSSKTETQMIILLKTGPDATATPTSQDTVPTINIGEALQNLPTSGKVAIGGTLGLVGICAIERTVEGGMTSSLFSPGRTIEVTTLPPTPKTPKTPKTPTTPLISQLEKAKNDEERVELLKEALEICHTEITRLATENGDLKDKIEEVEKAIVANKEVDKLGEVGYQTEITQLQNKIKEIQKKEEETQIELKKLQEEKDNKDQEIKDNDAEIIEMLERALVETAKIDTQLLETKNLFEELVKKLQAKLVSHQKEINDVQDRIKDLKSKNSQEIQTKEKELKNIRDKLSACQRERDNIQKELDRKIKELENSNLSDSEKQVQITKLLVENKDELNSVGKQFLEM
ncbi:5936_t:CDS:2 [Ambispora gerdemannii]|uniref:5936_t:CDS:1 n=1 Tax=Ambispora gerdemannii TaxID=144530 RepID=A0A9N8V2V3_9GLOM|nr:5936_t:CDS:2 [Ambispora gerdemannii]